MAKRPAESPAEDPSRAESTANKRPRVEDVSDPPLPRGDALAERRWEDDERSGKDILAAADRETEEIREAEGDNDFDSADEAPAAAQAPARQTAPLEGYGDLYLDTIDRSVLDFDFEKLCSISLSNINVYTCLVCGKYFQGRGPKSHAYFHALEEGHHVYINMETKKVYVLPEGYEVKSKSLEDIKYVVDPSFTKEDVVKLDKTVIDARDLSGKRYRPGTISPLRGLDCNTRILY
jgi:U4/U6.U5 tri-snRNP-associated protein 2